MRTMHGSFRWPLERKWYRFRNCRESMLADFGQFCYLGMSGAELDTIWFRLTSVSS